MSFSKLFHADNRPTGLGGDVLEQFEEKGLALKSPEFTSFMRTYSGCSFNNGIYRVHEVRELEKWTNVCTEVFPQHKGRFLCFSSNWVGQQFALDFTEVVDGEFQILLLDPGESEAYEVPYGFSNFHDVGLSSHPEGALETELYQEWLESGGAVPKRDECASFIVPAVLGGDFEIENLEICDMEVYWGLSGQILEQTRDLPPGTVIGDVNISE